MKIKTACLGALTLVGLLWACWCLAYQQGYSQGTRDEFACWKQQPIAIDRSWDGLLVAQRDAWALPGGKKSPPPVVRIPNEGVNSIPSSPRP